jgi:hypothetical protein
VGSGQQPGEQGAEPRAARLCQTYAVDLIHVPSGEWQLELGWSPLSRPATDFVSFGQPVVAPADGTVVRTYDRARDRRSRTSWLGLLYLIPESAVRELPFRFSDTDIADGLPKNEHAFVANDVSVRE